jgi:hypothetical protein
MANTPVDPSFSSLVELASAIAALRSLPPSDAEERKAREAECAILIQLEEQQLLRRELVLKEQAQTADTEMRRVEFALKERTAQRDKWTNPLTVGVIVGSLGLMGNFANGLWNNLNQHEQLANQQRTEQIKLENDLIKEAIKPSTEEDRAKSLVFFAKNGLIRLAPSVVESLVKVAGTNDPVPGSSTGIPVLAKSLPYNVRLVDRVLEEPRKGVPLSAETKRNSGLDIRAIILHDGLGKDSLEPDLRSGPNLGGRPAAHWLVKSDGTIVKLVSETVTASHMRLPQAAAKDPNALRSLNTIAVTVTGSPALENERQAEALVRLMLDICQRWELPPEKILSHAEVDPLRPSEMRQQGAVVRDMVSAAMKRAAKNER